jgi:hypothetical protein
MLERQWQKILRAYFSFKYLAKVDCGLRMSRCVKSWQSLIEQWGTEMLIFFETIKGVHRNMGKKRESEQPLINMFFNIFSRFS